MPPIKIETFYLLSVLFVSLISIGIILTVYASRSEKNAELIKRIFLASLTPVCLIAKFCAIPLAFVYKLIELVISPILKLIVKCLEIIAPPTYRCIKVIFSLAYRLNHNIQMSKTTLTDPEYLGGMKKMYDIGYIDFPSVPFALRSMYIQLYCASLELKDDEPVKVIYDSFVNV